MLLTICTAEWKKWSGGQDLVTRTKDILDRPMVGYKRWLVEEIKMME